MGEYSEECLLTFLKDQTKLFDEPVAETMEEAEAFLEDCMAVVLDSISEVRTYFEESGADVDGMKVLKLRLRNTSGTKQQVRFKTFSVREK